MSKIHRQEANKMEEIERQRRIFEEEFNQRFQR